MFAFALAYFDIEAVLSITWSWLGKATRTEERATPSQERERERETKRESVSRTKGHFVNME